MIKTVPCLGFMAEMRLESIQPSRLPMKPEETNEDYFKRMRMTRGGGDEEEEAGDVGSREWTNEISLQEAHNRLEHHFFPFKKVRTGSPHL